MHWGLHKMHLFLCSIHFEDTLWAIHHMEELKQLQPLDQHHQQFKTGNLLVQTSPPHEEFIIEAWEKLILPLFMEQIPSIQNL